LPLFTGPGHAVIMTGGYPYKTGIVGNEWWDRAGRHVEYCVADSDPTARVVGAAEGSHVKPMGPGNLRSSTVGDELKLATGGRSRVVTFAIKDRAAILLGGHAQDVSLWFDTAGGRWISSTDFCRDGALPAWVQALNDEHVPDAALGSTWAPSLKPEVLAANSTQPAHLDKDIPAGMGERFPHPIGAEKTPANYRAFTYTPAANAFVFDTARRAVAALNLGKGPDPDILAFNLSTNDYVGHAFGPYSAEVLDLTVQTDRQLSGLINALNHDVPGGVGSVLFVLTADHGVSPIPDDAAAEPYRLTAGRYSVETVLKTISAALTSRFSGPVGGSWFASALHTPGSLPKQSGAFIDGFISLDEESVTKAIESGKARDRREIERAACDAINGAGIPGVYGCYGRLQILGGALPDTAVKPLLSRAIDPQRSSDLIVIADPMFLPEPDPEHHATSHGTPYAYDSHVALLVCQPGLIKAGTYPDPVSPADIAPTLSLLLGIELPSGCDGRPLSEALRP
jgi:predicted AlkP superfamily pyrophosphatase or phosphodiesterase